MPPVSTTYYPRETPMVETQSGIITPPWDHFFAALSTLALTVNGIPGQNLFTLAGQPSLGPSDAGYVGYVTDFAHFVRWTGAAWDWLDGDRPGKIEDYVINPGTGYQLCDGTVTSRLAVGGAALTTVAFTTPNLTGTPAYRKSIAAYTGVINAASGSTGTGSTGTGTTGTGTTGAGSAHHHTQNFNAGVTAGGVAAPSAAAGGVSLQASVVGNTDDESGHTHSVPSLSVPSLSVPALGVGSLDMPNVGMLPYFRR